jgi:alanine dehydrogenase
MRIGIPREVKDNEYRVAITPAGVHELTGRGHEVFVQSGAGAGSAISDADYAAAGAKVLAQAEEVWGQAELLLKVKEPVAAEYPLLRPDLVLFTFLHLAADRALTLALAERGTTAIAYETVQLADRSLPLLAPMSEVAGRLAPQVGAATLLRAAGGAASSWAGCRACTPRRSSSWVRGWRG